MRLRALFCSFCVFVSTVGIAQEVPRDTTFTPWSSYLKIRDAHPEAVLADTVMSESLKSWRDVPYTTLKDSPYPNRQLLADVFRPDNDSIYPALIMIYGGGWNSGSKLNQRAMALRIAEQGYVTIPIEYRLIPEALYPAGLHDVKTAVRWVRTHARDYGIDPSRIAVSGCSAGGQLATLAGVTNRSTRHEGDGEWREASSEVQAIVDMDGIATFLTESNLASVRESYAKKGVKPVSVQWLGGFYEDSPKNWEEASALNWISPWSAPICIIRSQIPRFTDGCDMLCDIYDKMGIYNERHQQEADIHPFWFFHPWIEPTVDWTVAFLDKILK